MSSLIPASTRVEFQPAGPWRWVGFDGCLAAAASLARLDHEGRMILVDADLRALAAHLCGRQYAAKGFDDTPGAVAQANIEIDEATLSDRVTIEGRPAVTTATQGRFRIACGPPSTKAGLPPTPDPQPMHEGTWRIRPPAAPRTDC